MRGPRTLLSLLCLAGVLGTAVAAPIPTETLLAPAAFSSPSLSPDGKRIAAVVEAGHNQHALLIAGIEAGAIRPLMKTTVPGLVTVDHYAWVSPEVLLLWINIGAGYGDVWAELDTRTRVLVQMHHEGAVLVRAHWGDADHVLIYDVCEHDQICLYNWNIKLNAGSPAAKPISVTAPLGFDVNDDNQIVTRAGGSGGQPKMRWNAHAQVWEPYTPESANDAVAISVADGFAIARARLSQANAPVAPETLLYTAGSHQAVGIYLPTAPGLRALHPDLDGPVVEVGKQLHGQQIGWLDISDDLATALIGAHEPGAPDTFYLWTRNGGLLTLQASHPDIASLHLPQLHVMSDWLGDGTPVSVLLAAPGSVHGPLLIRALVTSDEISRLQSARYDGSAESLAQNGMTIVSVPVPAGTGGGQGAVWRQWATERVQRVAERAVQMGLGTRDRICIWGEGYGAYAALAAAELASQPGYACAIAINAELQYLSNSKPLYTIEGNVRREFIRSEQQAALLHSMWLDGESDNRATADPVGWAARLPAQVFLAFRTYAGDPGTALKDESGPFEAALKSAGKHLTVYASDALYDEPAKWNAGMYGALTATALQAAPP